MSDYRGQRELITGEFGPQDAAKTKYKVLKIFKLNFINKYWKI
jgi:hypothetical protein